jgi:hypothetical protein
MTLKSITVGGLPAGATLPSGWTRNKNFIYLGSYTAKILSTSKSGATAPHYKVTSTVAIGQKITIWNGTGYTPYTIPSATGQSITKSLTAKDGTATVTITANLSIPKKTTAHTTPTACKQVCSASFNVASPVAGTLTYRVTNGATVIATFTLTVKLGSLSVTTTYQEAS